VHGVFCRAVKDIYDILREWKKRRGEKCQSGSDFALATLVHAKGSTYRPPGARMLICNDGKTVGSLSAGCLEEEVALRARQVLLTGEPALMSFDTRKRFGCAGKIDIFIECAAENFFVDLAENLDARHCCAAITRFTGDKSGTRIQRFDYQHEQERELWQRIHPPVRLVIFGGGADSVPLHLLANSLGWQTFEVIDANQLPIEPDEWTAAIVKSHSYGRDFAVLQRLLPLDLRYVGLVGPRKRRNQLLSDLLDLGLTINAGFFAPAGLDLGAETPEEIALAIVSEIQRVFAATSGESLRDRKTSIHANATCSFQGRRLPTG
jgi:xanthine dehydrogenase accessory factor